MPAFKSGVRQFDVITAVDDEEQVTQEALRKIVFSKEPGQTIRLRLIRQAQPIELSVHVEEVQPLDSDARDPLFGGPMGMEDFQIDLDSFTTGNPLGIQFADPNRPVIQFGNEGSAFLYTRPGFSNLNPGQGLPTTLAIEAISHTTADIRGLEVQVKLLTERIASLEAMITRLAGEQPVTAPAGATKP